LSFFSCGVAYLIDFDLLRRKTFKVIKEQLPVKKWLEWKTISMSAKTRSDANSFKAGIT